MTLYIGSTPLSKAYIGSTELQKIYVGSTEVWSNFTPMGEVLTTQTAWTSTTPKKLVGWGSDSAFPGTVVVSDGLQMNGSKSATLSFSLTYRHQWNSTINVAAYVGGVQRGTTFSFANPENFIDVTKTGTIAVNVTAGEVVDLYVWTSGAFQITFRTTSKWSIS